MIGQNYIASSDFSSQSRVVGNSLISVKTSDKTFKSVGSGGLSPVNHASYSVKGTTSFSSIHKDVSQTVYYSTLQAYSAVPASTGAPGPGPDVPAIGEDELGSPVGDMLLPMLAIALGYIVVKLFRNRKTSQAL